ncbi:MAG: amidohydrolase family protein [Alcanivoracaceae bacterium]|nr:amidohydrolase family protein [Alcanivoracaceae bacterium]
MKSYILLILYCISIISTRAQAQSILIKADAYLDVRTGKLVKPANILIEDGLITAINPQVIPDNIDKVDLGNKILLPGLMDMHVHLDLDFNGGFEHIITKESASKGAIRAVKNAEKTLMAGFTTIRNVGQGHLTTDLVNVAVSEASDEGWIKAPRIIAAGHMITITGGHGDLTLGLAEELIKVGPEHGIINGPIEALKAVRYQIKHGAKVIKIHATAGVLSLEDSVGAQQLTNEEMKVIVDEANRHHIKVAAHAHGTEGIIAAINAGVASIEHGSLINDKAMKLMKEKGVILVPTTGLVDNILSSVDKINPKMVKKARYVLPLAQQNLSKAIKAGVKIALGTDAPLIPHGHNANELSAMVARGMQPIDALRAATINSAELLGMENIGEIKIGFLADIIAVELNPIKNIETLKSVKFVMKAGIIYKQ